MRLTVLLIVIAVLSPPAAADSHYLCYSEYPNRIIFAKIPGPGTFNDLEVVDILHGLSTSNALTWDGDNWWVEKNGDVYCFDEDGDYVTDFPAPSGDITGLAWDGEYLWMIGDDEFIYQRDVNGVPGPYSPFDDVYQGRSLAVVGDYLIVGNADVDCALIQVYDFNGDQICVGYNYSQVYQYSSPFFTSLAYHDGMVWAHIYEYDPVEGFYVSDLYGLDYSPSGWWSKTTTVTNEGIRSLTVCEADWIGIASSSLGKIKAYFNEE